MASCWLSQSLLLLVVSLFTLTTMNPVKRHMHHKEVCGELLAEALKKTCVSYRGPFSVDLRPGDDSDQGIVDECCYKRCNISQLSQYCAVSKELSFAEKSKMVDMNELTEDDSLSLVPDVEVTDPPTKAEVMYIDFEEGPLILVPVHAAPNFAPYVYDSVDSRFFQ